MNLLYLDQTGQLGGAELSMFDLVTNIGIPGEIALFADGPFREMLERAGLTVNVLDAAQVAGVRREHRLGSVLNTIPSLLKLRRQVVALADSKDLIYANTQKAFVVAALAEMGRRSRVVWHLRDMLTANHFSPQLRRIVVSLANRCAAAVIANSKATRNAFIEAGGRLDRVSVVHNGISPLPFDSVSDIVVREGRLQLCKPANSFLIGVFGRLSPWKGQHVLLEALENLPENVHGVLVGDALFGEQSYVDDLRRRATSERLRGRVHFLGFRKDIPALMKMMDVVVHTSVAPEPFGRVLVEGMLAERPVVATAAGGALEIIEDGRSGRLVPPGDAGRLAATLQQLQNDSEYLARIAAAGRKRAIEQFSMEAMVSGVKQVLEETRNRLNKHSPLVSKEVLKAG